MSKGCVTAEAHPSLRAPSRQCRQLPPLLTHVSGRNLPGGECPSARHGAEQASTATAEPPGERGERIAAGRGAEGTQTRTQMYMSTAVNSQRVDPAMGC